MDKLRKEAREALVLNPGKMPVGFFPAVAAASKSDLGQLWQDIAAYDHSTHLNICESLVTATSYIDYWDGMLPNDQGPRTLKPAEAKAVNNLFDWASAAALPSSDFAVDFDETAEISDDIIKAQNESRFRSELALELILVLNKPMAGLPNGKPDNAADILLAGACFVNQQNPWVTSESYNATSMLMNVWVQDTHLANTFWPAIDFILKERIRPLFAKTKNPAITSAGRKNFHPQTLPRFGASDLDASAKPWKTTDVYVASVLSWILSQYRPEDKAQFETHFQLFVPTILAMIDDNNIPFKTKGCALLIQLLQPIQESGSDILRRTNLTSVFEDAVTPCLLSLPSITPEDRSLELLGEAYPALLSTLKTAYKGPTQSEQDKEAYTTSLAKILRSNLISSFHHVSSGTPASFPHPRLSTFLLQKITIVINELGIHTTKYLQEIIPVLHTTLSNPFGTAHPPLLLAAAAATQAVIKNAHPRIWRWRGEILSGLSSCWLHIAEDSRDSVPELAKLKRELRQTLQVLKVVLLNPVAIAGDAPEPEQLQVKENVEKEFQELVDADAELKGLFA
ncbi:hypothetical protein DTO013E5_131 [Penicillium roqueforti]|uniref:uncharacterized protein n=1 Tax=Penicillium roqueforti TaxID=5082 RepID=UPI00190B4B48|nr:uncharacterized protein LCP9604111_1006 [Penicillium roqueforti]XP_057044742.1 uncharacterized protein N7518_002364 [Penicillium psychrosexuale]KAF9253480.1 hypothetical protein LCP9604111_1006 [Penicillium roqueforti]KAI2706510.1 hypothetical protein CBS147372_421 [Penicillium roqueforti]KAI2723148.1 hypothetical protein CBS147318_79 [Penicillium roqueforti]KAI2731256.1 hypothetical protein CBS147354_365 [Penicillium roqueforti]KAI2746666.1 hypothetical protein DTO012A1_1497 [Penicillium 